jgi:hypothetical protein
MTPIIRGSTKRAALLVAVLAIAALSATSADAATKAKRPGAPYPAPESTCRGGNLFHCGPVTNGNDYLGSDPDPFIRLMIQRDLGARYGGGQ